MRGTCDEIDAQKFLIDCAFKKKFRTYIFLFSIENVKKKCSLYKYFSRILSSFKKILKIVSFIKEPA